MKDFEEGIEIIHLTEDQEQIIIHTGEINRFHQEYVTMKKEVEDIKKKLKYWVDIHTDLKKWLEEEIDKAWEEEDIKRCAVLSVVQAKIKKLENGQGV